uniref:Uncharacterized protein n=1 Tax=Sphaerodactylus townsendi TaxID=933632 RepID=A0ACB8F732_9SAUR
MQRSSGCRLPRRIRSQAWTYDFSLQRTSSTRSSSLAFWRLGVAPERSLVSEQRSSVSIVRWRPGAWGICDSSAGQTPSRREAWRRELCCCPIFLRRALGNNKTAFYMKKLRGRMDHFLRKHLAFFANFWNKFLPNSVPNSHSLDFLEPDLGSLNPTQDPMVPGPSSSLFGVLYDFTARSADELSVNRGDKVCVLKEEGEYVLARRLSGEQVVGYVPTNYISKINQEPVTQPA